MESSILDPTAPDLAGQWLEHAPSPMAFVEGATHTVRYLNAAFCRLIGKDSGDIVGQPFCELLPPNSECLALLDRVFRTGKPASLQGADEDKPGSSFLSYSLWPVLLGRRPTGAVIQVMETPSLVERTRAMNEALLLGSLRQHELTSAAASSNVLLQTEIEQRKQSERDALMLTKEVAHRIKNNLQIFVALVASEIRRTPAEFAHGYVAMQTRIAAIAELYDLMSQSSRGPTLRLDEYLRGIARMMTASLLGSASGISIVVDAEALEIDPERAVPLGLVVNELGTNAVKHAFPTGVGEIRLTLKQDGDQIELVVADNGVGKPASAAGAAPGRHGSDYVAIFVRQLGGTIVVSGGPDLGMVITVRFPLLPALQRSAA